MRRKARAVGEGAALAHAGRCGAEARRGGARPACLFSRRGGGSREQGRCGGEASGGWGCPSRSGAVAAILGTGVFVPTSRRVILHIPEEDEGKVAAAPEGLGGSRRTGLKCAARLALRRSFGREKRPRQRWPPFCGGARRPRRV